jgi:hypothetical protein
MDDVEHGTKIKAKSVSEKTKIRERCSGRHPCLP